MEETESYRLAMQWYKRIQTEVEAKYPGKVIAIDVNSGEYEIGEVASRVAMILRRRVPGAYTVTIGVGGGPAGRLGARQKAPR